MTPLNSRRTPSPARSLTPLLLFALALLLGGISPRPLRAEPGPLEATSGMRVWAASTVPLRGHPERHIALLHQQLLRRGWVERDGLTLPAAEAFLRGQGDCVSFSLVLTAIARARGLDTVFVIDGSSTSSRADDFQLVRQHIGVALVDGTMFYDARLRPIARSTGMRVVSDETAIALYHSNLGARHLLDRSWERAREELVRATLLDPNLPEAWSNLGIALSRSGDPAGAESAYWRTVRLAPTWSTGWRNLALLLDRQRPASATGSP